jgi:hypothetical protein
MNDTPSDDSREIVAIGILLCLFSLGVFLGIGGCSYLCDSGAAKLAAAQHETATKPSP